MQKLISSGYDVNAVDEDERTALHWAAAAGHMEVVEYLTDKSKIDHQDDAGWTPLMSAASAGHVDVVSYLINKLLLFPTYLS